VATQWGEGRTKDKHGPTHRPLRNGPRHRIERPQRHLLVASSRNLVLIGVPSLDVCGTTINDGMGKDAGAMHAQPVPPTPQPTHFPLPAVCPSVPLIIPPNRTHTDGRGLWMVRPTMQPLMCMTQGTTGDRQRQWAGATGTLHTAATAHSTEHGHPRTWTSPRRSCTCRPRIHRSQGVAVDSWAHTWNTRHHPRQ
jgi:hypothetical protein